MGENSAVEAREAMEECMVEFLGGSREEVDPPAEGGPGGLGADFFFLRGAWGPGASGGRGDLARAPSLAPRGAATGASMRCPGASGVLGALVRGMKYDPRLIKCSNTRTNTP